MKNESTKLEKEYLELQKQFIVKSQQQSTWAGDFLFNLNKQSLIQTQLLYQTGYIHQIHSSSPQDGF